MGEEIHIKDFVRKLLTTLNECGVEYLLVGGVAAVHYGRSRSTLDCDIILSLNEDELNSFCDCLKSKGFEIREYDVIMGFKEKSHFNAYLTGYPYRVDFSWKRGSLAEFSFKRAKEREVFGVKAIIEEPEDLIIAKLVYGSQQDFDDALAVLLEQRGIDKKYLETRAEEEGVKDKLKELFKKAGE